MGLRIKMMRLIEDTSKEQDVPITTVQVNGPATFKYNGTSTASFSLHSVRLILK